MLIEDWLYIGELKIDDQSKIEKEKKRETARKKERRKATKEKNGVERIRRNRAS
jgi:hypothetical protein